MPTLSINGFHVIVVYARSEIELQIIQLYVPQVRNHHQSRWMPFCRCFFPSSSLSLCAQIKDYRSFFLSFSCIEMSNLIASVWLSTWQCGFGDWVCCRAILLSQNSPTYTAECRFCCKSERKRDFSIAT